MKLGFIGFGHMAKAICKGIIQNGLLNKKDIGFFAQTKESREQTVNEFGIQAYGSNQELWDNSDFIILAVKPHILEDVLNDLDKTNHPFVISIAAGVSSSFYKSYLNKDLYLRTMPNLNAQVQESMTAIVENDQVKEKHLERAEQIFQAVGKTVIIPENDIDVFTAIAGSSPALTFMFIDTIARAAVRHGMKKDKATEIAAQAVLGSGKTVLNSDESPWNLIDQVSSPGGVTTEGILNLLEEDFTGPLIHSVDKMVDKNKNMGN